MKKNCKNVTVPENGGKDLAQCRWVDAAIQVGDLLTGTQKIDTQYESSGSFHTALIPLAYLKHSETQFTVFCDR